MKLNLLIKSIPLSLFFLLCSCVKYEEGPLISLRSAETRIEGCWRVDRYNVNGVDSMEFIINNHLNGEWVFSYRKRDNTIFPVYQTFQNYTYNGFWETYTLGNTRYLNIAFHDKSNKDSTLISFNSSSTWPINGKWEILRLKNNDMKISQYNANTGKRHDIHFKPF
ncbi:MAG: hypothetical protein ACK40G_00250 [Cytophagaceae bacterium]